MSEITVRATAKFRFATPDCALYLHSHFTTAGADAPHEHTLKIACEGSDRAEAEGDLGPRRGVTSGGSRCRGDGMRQVFRMGCHGCGAEEEGFASTREMAFVAIDDWQGRHKLGCSGPLWYSVGPAKVAAEETT